VRSLTTRVVVLAVVVALASTLISIAAFAALVGTENANTGMPLAVSNAGVIAASLEDNPLVGRQPFGSRVRVVRAQRQLLRGGGRLAVVRAGSSETVAPPFTADDVTNAEQASGQATQSRRDVAGTSWAIAAQVAGDAVVLVAEPVNRRELTAPQRRQLALVGLLSLVVGGLAGLALARGATRPLARVADAARRLTAGERGVQVVPAGPAEVADVARALDTLSVALGHSEARQREFLLAVSHELRTPLTAVSGYAEALAEGALPVEQVPAAAGVIRDEAGRLQHRVEDLLALARLEADDFRIELGPVDLVALVQAAALACAPRAVRAHIPVSVQCPVASLPVVTDGERLRQAVDALVDNALRVLPEGAALVLACHPAGPGWAAVEVRDGGPGLAPEDLAVAFERGVLTQRYRGTRTVGSGLGLALVGELARRLGGHAQASPAAEGGVCFAVVLPVG